MTDRHKNHQEESDCETEGEQLQELAPARIFDADYCGETVPEGFNGVRISLDGGIHADLSWEKERKAAEEYVKKGLRLFWDLDLGIPAALPHPLSHRSQFLSLSLSLEHFRDTLWKLFRKETIGLCLYRGTADFSCFYPWSEEQMTNLREWFCNTGVNREENNESLIPQILEKTESGQEMLRLFCCDAIGEYLNLLAGSIPDPLPLFLLLDATDSQDPFINAQLLTKQRYTRFHLAVKGEVAESLGMAELSWSGSMLSKGTISRRLPEDKKNEEKAPIGVCLPENPALLSSLYVDFHEALAVLYNQQISFRMISELQLTGEWEELDYLIVDTKSVGKSLRRKLCGFCAAGGTIVSVGPSLGLPQEINFKVFVAQISG